ncbi:hypothetical protein GOBAR_DD31436 [Gossypium barbadense]|nr:hypothetical protein GOBAR_DD31436 [Gossypium barbadense]
MEYKPKFIWKKRCEVILGGKQEGVVEEVWGRPPEEWVKINCGGTFDVKNGKASVGVICRDYRGMVLDGAAEKVIADEAKVVEARAITKGIKLAVKNRWENVLQETNSSSVNNFLILRIRRDIKKAADWVAKHGKVEIYFEGWIHHLPSSLVFILGKDGLSSLPIA